MIIEQGKQDENGHVWRATGLLFCWAGWVRPPPGVKPDTGDHALTCDRCHGGISSVGHAPCRGVPPFDTYGFWSQEVELPDSGGERVEVRRVRASVLTIGQGTVAGFQLVVGDGYETQNVDLTVEQAEALIVFLQEHLPRVRKARDEGGRVG